MSDFEQNSHQPGYQSSSLVWNIAALSAFVFLLSVLGAKLLSQVVDSDVASRLVYERAMRSVTASTAPKPAAATPQSYSVVRSVGVDGITTATIPLHKAAPVSPCGDDKAAEAANK
jgi:hypothetical protein